MRAVLLLLLLLKRSKRMVSPIIETYVVTLRFMHVAKCMKRSVTTYVSIIGETILFDLCGYAPPLWC